ncbi:hypothetical protein [Paraburkholderia sp. 32]|uniref:hypothetical protein n=1 Tax=Paraburkholderia sp. 32 TaxID=2991057 RepID=UPI003D21C7BD
MGKIDLVLEDGELFAAYRKGNGALTRKNLSVYLPIYENCSQLLHSMCRFVARLSRRSAPGYLHVIVELGKTLRRLAVESLPCCEAEWQALVLNICRDVIVNPVSRASLYSRAC